MDNKELCEILKEVAPGHLEPLLDLLRIVMEELDYTKSVVEKELKTATNQNDFEKMHKLVEAAKTLHDEGDRIKDFLDVANFKSAPQSTGAESANAFPAHKVVEADASVACDLFSAVTYKKPAAISLKGQKRDVKSWKEALIVICEMLYEKNKVKFESLATDNAFKGKKKRKISKNPKDMFKPVEILNTGIYVETNLSAEDIVNFIAKLVEKYNISTDEVKLYISKVFIPK